jgi:tetratricopeptide (TPR) repeat protein
MGQYDQTLLLYESTLEIRKSELGDRHPDTAASLNNLAVLYRSMGQYDRALPLYEAAVSLFEELLGHDHPNTKVVQGNLQLLRKKIDNAELGLVKRVWNGVRSIFR